MSEQILNYIRNVRKSTNNHNAQRRGKSIIGMISSNSSIIVPEILSLSTGICNHGLLDAQIATGVAII